MNRIRQPGKTGEGVGAKMQGYPLNFAAPRTGRGEVLNAATH
jgi:hypothetical protein